MGSGGISRMQPTKVSGKRSRANIASIPEFMRRSLKLIDPAAADEPLNRAQRRAQKRKPQP